jgi:four helix bundle protein
LPAVSCPLTKKKGFQVTRSDFEKLRVYQLAEMLANFIWEVVIKWNRLAQDTVGRQLINSGDSIGANIAEGSGRGSFADNRRFARIARGSLFEVKHWLRRAYNRKLLSEVEVARLSELIEELTPKLSAYIKSIGKQYRDKLQLTPDEPKTDNQN